MDAGSIRTCSSPLVTPSGVTGRARDRLGQSPANVVEVRGIAAEGPWSPETGDVALHEIDEHVVVLVRQIDSRPPFE